MPIIDPKVEEPTRDMLGLAIRGELTELAALIQSVGGERYRQILGMCLSAAAYIAIDVSERWPTDADVREVARMVAERGTEVKLDQAEVYDYLSAAALGFQPLPVALGDDVAAATLPLLITGSMLFTFRPEGRKWWEYLDQIWSAYEKAEATDASVLPALQVRVRVLKKARSRDELFCLTRLTSSDPETHRVRLLERRESSYAHTLGRDAFLPHSLRVALTCLCASANACKALEGARAKEIYFYGTRRSSSQKTTASAYSPCR